MIGKCVGKSGFAKLVLVDSWYQAKPTLFANIRFPTVFRHFRAQRQRCREKKRAGP